tara:strand:+ start:249 stop:422 length:174 start_codon:yes stop_codon:yes gene_type:complete
MQMLKITSQKKEERCKRSLKSRLTSRDLISIFQMFIPKLNMPETTLSPKVLRACGRE